MKLKFQVKFTTFRRKVVGGGATSPHTPHHRGYAPDPTYGPSALPNVRTLWASGGSARLLLRPSAAGPGGFAPSRASSDWLARQLRWLPIGLPRFTPWSVRPAKGHSWPFAGSASLS